MDWYRFFPVDTLYFKGAQPMNLGENHTASHIFPPPAHTLLGALRTAVLGQQAISIQDYAAGNAPPEIYDAIGKPGGPAPFSIIGPLFMMGKKLFVPAPYSWFMEKENVDTKVAVIKGRTLKSRLLKVPAIRPIWARGESGEIVSMGGSWIRSEDLEGEDSRIAVKKVEDFFENEPRTGIALERNGRVREGHLYSFNHSRLKRRVSLVFGADRKLPLAEKGVLKLGAEQRFGWYEKLAEITMHLKDEGENYLSLSILEGTPEANESVIATGKIQFLGGWDLHAGFHKPMRGFFPAGTVCSKRINSNFIAIKGVEPC